MSRKATDRVTAIGIDIGKNSFHLIGLDAEGSIALRQKLSRGQLLGHFANLPPCPTSWAERWRSCRRA